MLFFACSRARGASEGVAATPATANWLTHCYKEPKQFNSHWAAEQYSKIIMLPSRASATILCSQGLKTAPTSMADKPTLTLL